MRHEEKHAVGMWLVAAFLGGFALLYWAMGRTGDGEGAAPPPVELRDSVA